MSRCPSDPVLLFLLLAIPILSGFIPRKYFIIDRTENLYEIIAKSPKTHIYISNQDCLRPPQLNSSAGNIVKIDGTDMNRFTIESYPGISSIKVIAFPIAVWGSFDSGYPLNGTLGTYYDLTALTSLERFSIWNPDYIFLIDDQPHYHGCTGEGEYYHYVKFVMKKSYNHKRTPDDYTHMMFVFKTKHKVRFSYLDEEERNELLEKII